MQEYKNLKVADEVRGVYERWGFRPKNVYTYCVLLSKLYCLLRIGALLTAS